MREMVLILSAVMIAGCVSVPRDIQVVEGFELERYLGTWYEIARLDHRFERGLDSVSAEYHLRDDGGIDVLNRGFNRESKRWKEAKGRAYPIGKNGQGTLKVTFFWPFYAGYNVIELDRGDYRYAMVCGPNKKYLWILARTTQLDREIVADLVEKAESLGFETSNLIYVTHQ